MLTNLRRRAYDSGAGLQQKVGAAEESEATADLQGSGAGWRRTNCNRGFVVAARVDAPGVRELGMEGSIG